MMSKRVLLDLDAKTHASLQKIAASNASRLKPYAEMVLREYVGRYKPKTV